MNKDMKVSEILNQVCFTSTFRNKITSASKDNRLQILGEDLHTWINAQCKRNCNAEPIDIEDFMECDCMIASINIALIKLSYIEHIIEKVEDKKQ